MPEKTLFEMFGHTCNIPSLYQTRVPTQFKGCKRFKETLRRVRSLNETNRRAYNILRSQKKIENEQKKHMLSSNIIHPFSDMRTYWELFIAVVLMGQFITVSMDLASHGTMFKEIFSYRDHVTIIRYVLCFFSFIDVIMNFITGYVNVVENVIVLEHFKIAKRYLTSTFLMDVFCSMPCDLIIERYNFVCTKKLIFVLHILQLVHILRYVTFTRYCCNFFETTGCCYIKSRMFIVIITFLLYTHVVCCVNMSWMNVESPWFERFIDHPIVTSSHGRTMNSFGVFYLRVYYASLMMVMNMGYAGSASSNAYKIHILMVWMISRFLYAIAIAYIMCLKTAANSSHEKYIDMLTEVSGYMRHRQIPVFLQQRILAYYDIRFKSSYYQEEEILNTISGELKQEISMHKCRKMVESVAFFKEIPSNLLVRMITSLKLDIYLTNDVITKAGTVGDCMYFISQGTVAVYTKSGKEVTHLEDGQYFGEVSLITDTLRTATVIATDVCELYKLTVKDFRKCIQAYPEMYTLMENVALERKETIELLEEMFRCRQTQNI